MDVAGGIIWSAIPFRIDITFKKKVIDMTMIPILKFEFDNNLVPRSGLKRCFVTIKTEDPKLVQRAFFMQFSNEETGIKPIVYKELMELSETRAGGHYLGKFDENVKEMNYYVEWMPISGGKYFSYLHLTKNDNETWLPQLENDWITFKKKKQLKKINRKLYDFIKKNNWK